MEIGKSIREFRIRQKMSQKAFAARIGTTQQNISNYENGIAQPSVDCLAKIAKEFSVLLDELFLGTSHCSTDHAILGLLAKLPEDKKQLSMKILQTTGEESNEE